MRRLGLAFALLLAAPALAASDAAPSPPPEPAASPPSDSETIVVEGKLEELIAAFVENLTQAGKTDQVARWPHEVCPKVFGLEPAQAEYIKARIRALARPLHLHAGRDCVVSLGIVVTPDADAFAAKLAREHPVNLRTDGIRRLEQFASSERPVRWLSVTDECGFGCRVTAPGVKKTTQPGLKAMIVLVDASRLKGVSIGELADYLAMVGLSNPPADMPAHPNSIMALFDGSKPEGTNFALTDYDLDFLTALYRMPMHLDTRGQRSSLRVQMGRTLEKASQTGNSAPAPAAQD